ncbi:sugar phosphate isomerase/epimerase, partial [Candidatus Poribacteria bacterium]|nr:sugar phosphate isomerase/epimerase [Candidatus Poribacteria bacterium]
MSRLSISSWSLHRALGPMYRPADDDSGDLVPHKETAGELSLLELPARVAQLGIKTLEICHFHFPTLDEDYISDLRSALKEADVELFSILVDAGDITHPDSAKREKDLQWIREWLEVTAKCGATHARVIAGDADITVDNGDAHEHGVIRLSAKNLRELARF